MTVDGYERAFVRNVGSNKIKETIENDWKNSFEKIYFFSIHWIEISLINLNTVSVSIITNSSDVSAMLHSGYTSLG